MNFIVESDSSTINLNRGKQLKYYLSISLLPYNGVGQVTKIFIEDKKNNFQYIRICRE